MSSYPASTIQHEGVIERLIKTGVIGFVEPATLLIDRRTKFMSNPNNDCGKDVPGEDISK